MKIFKLLLIASFFVCTTSLYSMDLTCHEEMKFPHQELNKATATKQEIAFAAVATITPEDISYAKNQYHKIQQVNKLTGLAIGRGYLEGYKSLSAKNEIRKRIERLIKGPKRQKRTCIKTIAGKR